MRTANISIHAPHTGRDAPDEYVTADSAEISIHAPHTGRDRQWLFDVLRSVLISIHAPHTGRDALCTKGGTTPGIFQSTRPIRGATMFFGMDDPGKLISIHAPHTGRDFVGRFEVGRIVDISIHAPHTGRDASRTARSHSC